MINLSKVLTGKGASIWDIELQGNSLGDTKAEVLLTCEQEDAFLTDVTQTTGVNVDSWIVGLKGRIKVNLYEFDSSTLATAMGWDLNSGALGPKYSQTLKKKLPVVFKGPVIEVPTEVTDESKTPTPAFDGSETDFTLDAFSNIGNQIEPGTVVIKHYDNVPALQETFTDDGFGNLVGDSNGTGTIDYTTGVATLSFNSAPAATDTVKADYTYNDTQQFTLYVPKAVVTASPGDISLNPTEAAVFAITFEMLADSSESRERLFYWKFESVTL